MFEKVNPAHPDKQADRIAGALVDLAYSMEDDPKIAVEVLLGHGACHILVESSVELDRSRMVDTVLRIAGDVAIDYREVRQDSILAGNQSAGVRCGDNGIFKGAPVTEEQDTLNKTMRFEFLNGRNVQLKTKHKRSITPCYTDNSPVELTLQLQ